jgi:ABC-type Fe3+/spermidine/putrescine transport system ATPase subunit
MQVELKQLQRELGMTFVYVTHDQEEALAMSDRIAVMNGGRLEQLDSPEQVYLRPATRFVAQFLGEANLLEGETDGDGVLHWGGVPVRVGEALAPGHAVVALRPERVTVYPHGTAPGAAAAANVATGQVLERLFVGTATRLVVTIGNHRLSALLPPGPAPRLGDTVTVVFAPEHCVAVAP